MKIQVGINFFQSFSVGSYFPFSYLNDHKILPSKAGILFQDDFEGMNIFKKWMDSNLSRMASVSREISQDDGNNTRCLVIRNRGKSTWVYQHRGLIEARIGDVFYYESFVNIKGDKLVTYLNITVYDANKKVIDWNLYKKKIRDIKCWTKINNTISISDPRIQFISFRLMGIGMGEFWYDNILFQKISAAATQ